MKKVNLLIIIMSVIYINNAYALQDNILKKNPSFLNIIEEFKKEHNLKQRIINKTPENIKNNLNKYLDAIFILSKYYEIDPVYLISLIWVESHFKNYVKSNVGASGLMQIMPKTEAYLYKKISHKEYVSLSASIRFSNPQISHEEASNLILGTYYINNLRKRFKKVKYFTAAYNMGPTWVNRKLKNNLPVGNKNNYVNKIINKYVSISKN